MSKFFHACLMSCLYGSLLFSLQGCDQIQKFVDYLSPSSKTDQEIVQPAKSPEPTPPAAVQPAVAPAQAEVKTEQPKAVAPNVLAKVGDWSITIGEFNEQLQALEGQGIPDLNIKDVAQRQYILGQLVQQQALVHVALKEKLDQDKNVIEAVKAFRDTILAQMLVEKMTETITVSDAEVQEFYQQNQNLFVGQPQWHVKEIVVDTEDKAKAIVAELNQGASFETIAKERSIGKTAAQGGDLGLVEEFEGNERMGQIVSALHPGEISGAFKGPEGFYVVKLVEKKDGESAKLSEIQEDLKNYILAMKQQQALLEALARAEQEMDIYINEKLLEE